MSATGRKKNGTTTPRVDHDAYPSPSWTIRAVIPHVPLGCLLDPCAGEGNVLVEAERAGYALRGIEIDPARYEEARKRTSAPVDNADALKAAWPLADVVLTNPPFSLAEKFLRKALAHVAPRRGTVAMLLRVGWLGSKARREFYTEYMPDVFILRPRPAFVRGATDSSEYAWFVFGPGRGGRFGFLDREDS